MERPNTLETLQTVLSKLFRAVMIIPIFVISFFTGILAYIAPWIIALATLPLLLNVWTDNQYALDTPMQYVASGVLIGIFILAVGVGMWINESINQ